MVDSQLPSSSPPEGGRRFTPEEALEIESDRRRRAAEAFLRGAEARPGRSTLRPWRGLAGGIALTIAIAVVGGMVALISATLDVKP
jgi:hypothetical protein